MSLFLFRIALAGTLLASTAYAQKAPTSAKPVTATAGPVNFRPYVLKGGDLEVQVDQFGSAISSVRLAGSVNPLSWALTREQMPKNNKVGAPFRGHFLCIGRWGSPSEEEIKLGMPHNGEVNNLPWRTLQAPTTANGQVTYAAQCEGPLDRYLVKRRFAMPVQNAAVIKTGGATANTKGNVFLMEESVTNVGTTGRIFNMVQHPTLGAPFLDQQTLIDCNAGQGFDQGAPFDGLDNYSFTWPNGQLMDGTRVDLRATKEAKGFVTTHLVDTTSGYGWIVATSPSSGQLYGYIWRTRDYGWLNVWNYWVDGKPFSRGLEFGTSGLGKPYRLLVEQQVRFFGHRMFDWLEAGETVTKPYVGFMAQVPNDWAGVSDARIANGKLVVKERGGQNRELQLETGAYLR